MQRPTLSRDQEYAYEKFKKGENLFITGPGGTGKTALIKVLVSRLKRSATPHQVCALTGCAAVLLKCNARTLHSWSGIKLARGPIDQIVSSVQYNKSAIKAWKKIKVLIVDEVSMMSKKILDVIEEVARLIRKNPAPFGGIQVIFTGDFYQLPPVGSAGDPESAQFCFESERWLRIFAPQNHIELTTMFRQTDPIYINILSQIRKGSIDDSSRDILRGYVKREFDPSTTNGCVPTKLFAVRAKADYVNSAMFSKLEEEEVVYDLVKRVDCTTYLDNGKALDTETSKKCLGLKQQEIEYEINQLIANTDMPIKLCLKKGTLVMLTYNLNVESGICNGSQGVIVDFLLGFPVVKFSNGVEIPIEVQYTQSEEYPRIAIGQIPLRLAWAMTIHKIQGATLEMADMDLGNTIFEYGQTYVGLSRIKSLDGLYLSAFHAHRIKANPIVTEFYKTIPPIPSEFISSKDLSSSDEESTNDNETNEKSVFAKFECPTSDASSSTSSIKVVRL
jgi:ATP-dependent DNA helicase PIF1